jgi:transposase-like protein
MRTSRVTCPLCRSERVYRSRRKGIVEKAILAMVFVRPFRCESCDLRFFRWALNANRNSPWAAPTC